MLQPIDQTMSAIASDETGGSRDMRKTIKTAIYDLLHANHSGRIDVVSDVRVLDAIQKDMKDAQNFFDKLVADLSAITGCKIAKVYFTLSCLSQSYNSVADRRTAFLNQFGPGVLNLFEDILLRNESNPLRNDTLVGKFDAQGLKYHDRLFFPADLVGVDKDLMTFHYTTPDRRSSVKVLMTPSHAVRATKKAVDTDRMRSTLDSLKNTHFNWLPVLITGTVMDFKQSGYVTNHGKTKIPQQNILHTAKMLALHFSFPAFVSQNSVTNHRFISIAFDRPGDQDFPLAIKARFAWRAMLGDVWGFPMVFGTLVCFFVWFFQYNGGFRISPNLGSVFGLIGALFFTCLGLVFTGFSLSSHGEHSTEYKLTK